ncbi:hypothetical protein A2U01_0043955 [Trifolium medium]|uniref:Uncharacterized protein n=1 Tax=Trifolium medium TaxID=97028 RepID=A0A392QFS4_9FABA|nr:hypothetical protein [Trifolium medium]
MRGAHASYGMSRNGEDFWAFYSVDGVSRRVLMRGVQCRRKEGLSVLLMAWHAGFSGVTRTEMDLVLGVRREEHGMRRSKSVTTCVARALDGV